MGIVIGKKDITSLGSDGCEKKFVCNIANNDIKAKQYFEEKTGLKVPQKDSPKVMERLGEDGEKGILLYLLETGKRIVSMDNKDNTLSRFRDMETPGDYIVLEPGGKSVLEATETGAITKAEYKTENTDQLRQLIRYAERGIDYIYQISFSPDFKDILPDEVTRNAYSRYNVKVSKTNSIRPDLIEIMPPDENEYILTKDFQKAKNDGKKYILKVCDIKTSEFNSGYFYELAYYMLLLRGWISKNAETDAAFDVSYNAKIFPYDIVKNNIRAGKKNVKEPEVWEMDFSLLHKRIFYIISVKIPDILKRFEEGDPGLFGNLTRDARCPYCDYYGGQYSKNLYGKFKTIDDYKKYIESPENNYCRYCLAAEKDINILPGLSPSDVKYLKSKGINVLDDLKTELEDPSDTLKNNPQLISKKQSCLAEISVREGEEKAKTKTDLTNLLASGMADLKIFTLLRQDSQGRTLSYAMSYTAYVRDVNDCTVPDEYTGNIDEGNLIVKTDYYHDMVAIPDEVHKVKAFAEFVLKIQSVLDVFSQIRKNENDHLTYGVFYWGRRSFTDFCKNLQFFLDYRLENKGLKNVYPELSEEKLQEKERKISEALNRFSDIFSNDEVTHYEHIINSPLFDLKYIYSRLVAVDTDYDYDLLSVYNSVYGKKHYNIYHMPDSDNYSAYAYEEWYNKTDREKLKSSHESIDKACLRCLHWLYSEFYGENKKFNNIRKKGKLPSLGANRGDSAITDADLADLFMFQKMNSAFDEMDTLNNHNAPDPEKQYGGKSVLLEELTGTKVTEGGLEEWTYRMAESAEYADLDESSAGLFIYPKDRAAESSYLCGKPDMGGDSDYFLRLNTYPYSYTQKYMDYFECNISEIDTEKKEITLFFNKYNEKVPESMRELENEDDPSGLDFVFTKDVYVEKKHMDFWSGTLKECLKDMDKKPEKQTLIKDPAVQILSEISSSDVENYLNHITGNKKPILDDSQKKAIANMYNHNISLLWGPPGTGKSHTLAHYLLLEMCLNEKKKVLLIGNYTPTNNLISSLIRSIKNYGPNDRIRPEIIRIMSSSKTPEPFETLNTFEVRDWVFRKNGEKLELNTDFTIVTTTSQQLAKIITNSNFFEQASDLNNFDIVIVDEASQMDIGHFMPALLRIKNYGYKMIIAGDDKQLQPIRKEEIQGVKEKWFGSVYNYYKNITDESGKVRFEPSVLTTSRRSNRCIIDFIRDTFAYDQSFKPDDDIKNNKVEYLSNDLSPGYVESVLKPGTGLALIEYDDGISGLRNDFEVDMIADLTKEIWKCGIRDTGRDLKTFFSEGIGIVVPHTAQKIAVRKKLIKIFSDIVSNDEEYDIKELINGAVDTVERFQGQERMIILAGYVLGNEDAIRKEESFIYDNFRMNVIISRAKYKAVLIASRELTDNLSDDPEIIELQKAFQKLKGYCNIEDECNDFEDRHIKIYRREVCI